MLAVTTSKLTKKFGRITALNELDLDIKEGEIWVDLVILIAFAMLTLTESMFLLKRRRWEFRPRKNNNKNLLRKDMCCY